MGAGNGRHLRVAGGDDLTANVSAMIAREREIRDEVLAFCAEIEALPLEGPDADDFRTGMWQRAHELRAFIAQRERYLRALPSPGALYKRATERLDDPDCETEAQHAALIAQSASASLETLAAQIRLFAEMRRRGLPV